MSGNNHELGPPKADFSAPPPYEQTPNQQSPIFAHSQQLDASIPTVNQTIVQQDEQHPDLQYGHGKLPTYEEVQMEKSLNGELPPEYLTTPPLRLPPPPNPLLSNLRVGNNGSVTGNAQQPALTFIAIDTPDTANSNNSLLGTDVMFALAFTIAFIFNWIGFLMLTCFCHTIAARYGALSGFGLSLAKWTLIVKNSTELASNENSWLWWLIMAFGFLICVRAFIQYISIKRTWRLLSTSAQERLLFFY